LEFGVGSDMRQFGINTQDLLKFLSIHSEVGMHCLRDIPTVAIEKKHIRGAIPEKTQ